MERLLKSKIVDFNRVVRKAFMIHSDSSLIYKDLETLSDLCDKVVTFSVPYEDVAESIEDKAYYECEHGDLDSAVSQLEKLVVFFENLQNKNEENSRDLAQVYLLIGQMYQYAQHFGDSISWFQKSIIVDDQYPVAYHSLAISYQHTGDVEKSIKSYEQEISVAPGNYYTYLILADLYEKNDQPCALESVLKRLLARDSDNIQGLHRLIHFYEKNSPTGDVELLRRKLLHRTLNLNRIEAITRAYHLCRMGAFHEALDYLDSWSRSAPDVTIIHLANAHIYGELHQYSRKRFELSLFKRKNHGREEVISIKLSEFASVFGVEASQKLKRRLIVAHPGHA